MKLKITFAALVASVIALAVSAESLRVKYAVTVDVLNDSGAVVGQRKLKPGTVVTLDESAEPAQQDAKGKADAKGKLKPSQISPTMFKTEKPSAGAVLRAEVSLSSYYFGQFDGKSGKYWSVDIKAKNDDWSWGEIFQGYAPRSLDVGKKIAAELQDGKDHRCLIRVVPIRDAYVQNMVLIKAIEFLAPEDTP